MTPDDGCNSLLAQVENLRWLEYADYALMSVGAIILIAAIIIPAIRSRRLARFTFHRRTRIPFEGVLIPAAAFFLFAFAMQTVLRPSESQQANHPEHQDVLVDQTEDAASTLDPVQAVLTTNVAMLAGAIAAYFVCRRFVSARSHDVFWVDRQQSRQIIDGIAAALVAFAMCYAAYQITILTMQWANPDFSPVEHQAIEAMQLTEKYWWLLPLIWVGTCVITPFAEELFFRGLVQTTLLRAVRRRWVAIILSAAIFSAGHARQIHVVPAIFLFGVILGVIYERRGALAGPVIAHALFNAKTILWQTLSAT